MIKVLIVYATDYQNTLKMAQAVAAGIQSVPDCEAILKAAETATYDDLIAADAVILGSPVHMGSADWRIKKFIDSCCSAAWMKDAVIGKVGAVFATGSGFGNAGGGCELTMLGLLNNLSVTAITQVATIERNAAGDITLITDSANASRLNALLVNLGQDTKRLRKMMSENFLIEAVYHATGLGLLPPEFRSKHTYIEVHENTGRDGMKDNLDVARVLGIITPAEEERRLGTASQFGRTTLYAELNYNSDAVRGIFLDPAGNPRTVEDYETLGRSALGALLSGDEGQELRLRYADLGLAGNDLWERMKQTGNVAGFGELFGLSNAPGDPRVAAAGSDYIAITDWAGAMSGAASAVRDIEKQLSGAAVAANDANLAGLRQVLKKRLTGVLKKTGEHFGDPLGMIMVYLASEQKAGKIVLITGDRIERLESSVAAISAAQTAG